MAARPAAADPPAGPELHEEWMPLAEARAQLEAFNDVEFLATLPAAAGEDLQCALQHRLDALNSTPVKLAVAGNSGTGKTTFVNTLRGLRPSDPQAAAVGVVETTREVTAYPFPNNPHIVLYDLPGVGTPNFPRETYVRDVGLAKFDVIVVMSKDRFTENDVYLAQQAQVMRKPYYFVRTQIDKSVHDNMEDHGVPPEVTLRQIRDDCAANLAGFSPERIFLVSGKFAQREQFDFPAFMEALPRELMRYQRCVLTMSLVGFSEKLIQAKYAEMKKLIPLYSAAAALGSAIPIPGTGIAVDLAVLKTASTRFAESFGLTEELAERYCAKTGVPKHLSAYLRTVAQECGESALKRLLMRYAGVEAASSAAKFVPLVGPVVAGGVGFTMCFYTLSSVLKQLRKHALHVGAEVGGVLIDQQFQRVNSGAAGGAPAAPAAAPAARPSRLDKHPHLSAAKATLSGFLAAAKPHKKK